MEFHEKLQELRKRKGLTQEELAEALYVSRTAISKWESGRGLPSIDSLKAISRYFSISLDQLLSGEALLEIAVDDQKAQTRRWRDLLYGALDCSMSLLLFLPFFAMAQDGFMEAVSLPDLTGVQPYLKIALWAAVLGMTLMGLLMLALQGCRRSFWQHRYTLSLCLNIFSVCLFILSRQPYAAVFAFVFLVIKGFLPQKGQ